MRGCCAAACVWIETWNWNFYYYFSLILSPCCPISLSPLAFFYVVVILASRAFRSPSNQWIMNFIRNWWVSARKWHHTVSFYTVVLPKWDRFDLWISNFWMKRQTFWLRFSRMTTTPNGECICQLLIDRLLLMAFNGAWQGKVKVFNKISRINEWLRNRVECDRFDGGTMRAETWQSWPVYLQNVRSKQRNW